MNSFCHKINAFNRVSTFFHPPFGLHCHSIFVDVFFHTNKNPMKNMKLNSGPKCANDANLAWKKKRVITRN